MRLPGQIYVDLIGKPFAEGGRGPDAFDCVGLVLELQRRQGRELGRYASTPEEFHAQFGAGGGMLGPCARLTHPEPGCIVLLRMLGGEMHLGTMIDRYVMLHTARQIGSAAIESLSAPLWRRRVLGYYAPVDAAEKEPGGDLP